jgi:hypothetical protein
MPKISPLLKALATVPTGGSTYHRPPRKARAALEEPSF